MEYNFKTKIQKKNSEKYKSVKVAIKAQMERL